MRVKHQRIDPETGEILPSRVPAYTQRMSKGWQMVKKYSFFTLKEESVLNALADHIDFENAISRKGQRLTPSQMSDLIGEDRRNFTKVFRSLQSKNAVGCWRSHDEEIWYINPSLYRRGHGHKRIATAFHYAAKEHEKNGSSSFSLPHEKYFGSLVTPTTYKD